jgi:hypothetical protein
MRCPDSIVLSRGRVVFRAAAESGSACMWLPPQHLRCFCEYASVHHRGHPPAHPQGSTIARDLAARGPTTPSRQP